MVKYSSKAGKINPKWRNKGNKNQLVAGAEDPFLRHDSLAVVRPGPGVRPLLPSKS